MSRYRDSYMVEKGPKNSGKALPPLFGQCPKEIDFSYGRCSLSYPKVISTPLSYLEKNGKKKNGQSPQAKPSMVALKVSSLKLGIARCEPRIIEPRATSIGQREIILTAGRRTDRADQQEAI